MVLDCIDSYFLHTYLLLLGFYDRIVKSVLSGPSTSCFSPDYLSRDVSSHSKPNLSLFAGSKRVFA